MHDENAEHVLVTYFITQIYLLYDQLMYTFLDDSDDMMALDIWKLFKTIKDQNKTIAAPSCQFERFTFVRGTVRGKAVRLSHHSDPVVSVSVIVVIN